MDTLRQTSGCLITSAKHNRWRANYWERLGLARILFVIVPPFVRMRGIITVNQADHRPGRTETVTIRRLEFSNWSKMDIILGEEKRSKIAWSVRGRCIERCNCGIILLDCLVQNHRTLRAQYFGGGKSLVRPFRRTWFAIYLISPARMHLEERRGESIPLFCQIFRSQHGSIVIHK